MTNTKRKLSSICPQCSSRVERFIINTDCEISMCESVNCSYPFNEQSAEGLNIETPNTSFIRYSKTNSKASSLSNTVALPTPDDAKSAKKARTSSYKPVSSSSSEKKQKDKIHLTKPSASDAPTVAVSAAVQPDLRCNVLPATPPKQRSSNNQQQSTASNNAISSFTPPPEADHQDPTKSTSATPPPPPSSSISSASSVSSSSSFINLFDFSMPSPTSSILSDTLSSQFDYSESPNGLDPAITELLNYYSDITQAPPPATCFKHADPETPPAMPGLCLPPMTAAKVAKVPTSNTLNINDYTLGDIESLLTIDNVNPPAQTEELSWMEDYNDLFL